MKKFKLPVKSILVFFLPIFLGHCRENTASLNMNAAGAKNMQLVMYKLSAGFFQSGLKQYLSITTDQLNRQAVNSVTIIVPESRPLALSFGEIDMAVFFHAEDAEKVRFIRRNFETPFVRSLIIPMAAFTFSSTGSRGDGFIANDAAIILENRNTNFLKMSMTSKHSLIESEDKSILQSLPGVLISTFFSESNTYPVIRVLGLPEKSSYTEIWLHGAYHRAAQRVKSIDVISGRKIAPDKLLNYLY